MPQIRGVEIDVLRQIFRSKSSETESGFIRQLNDNERRIYLTLGRKGWRIIAGEPGLIGKAADFLFPKEPEPLRAVGRLLAKKGSELGLLNKVVSMHFALKREARLWKHYHDTGRAVIDDLEEKSCSFILTDYPDLPPWMTEYICGYLAGIVTAYGSQDCHVTYMDGGPDSWKWEIEW